MISRKQMRSHKYKEVVEYIFCLLGLLLTAPLFLLIAILICLDSKGSPLFIQERVGKDGKVFRLYKFRTLFSDQGSKSGDQLVVGDSRITRMGRILRPSGLDELPQLLNVMRGEMTLIGPRPCLPTDLAGYSEFQKQRLGVKPGLSGMVAVFGGHHLSWKQKIRIDIWYIRNRSLSLDFQIVMKSLRIIFLGRPLYGKSGKSEMFKRVDLK